MPRVRQVSALARSAAPPSRSATPPSKSAAPPSRAAAPPPRAAVGRVTAGRATTGNPAAPPPRAVTARPTPPPTCRVVVSFTTVPGRLDHAAAHIANLLRQQTRPPDRVVLNLPRTYADPALGACPPLPTSLVTLARADRRVHVHRCADLGPGTKVAGLGSAPAAALGPTDYVVYLDDDHAYHPKTVERHVAALDAHPGTVFCTRGSTLDGLGGPNEVRRTVVSSPPMHPVDVPEGCGSVAFRAADVDVKALAAAIEAGRETPALCYSDDVALGNYYWGRGLTVRLLPVDTAVLGAFAYSRDATALMEGRGGTMGSTGARMRQAIIDLGSRLALPGIGPVGSDRGGPAARLAARMVPLDRDPARCPPPPPTRDFAVVIYAFARPEYLERTLRSLLRSAVRVPPEHTYVFVDGSINCFSGERRGNPARVRACGELARALLGPRAHVWCGACNYGVALMQHFGMHRVFTELGYAAALFLEDDMVLGRHYVGSTVAMLPALTRAPQLSAVQGGYRRHDAEPNDLLLIDSRDSHVHYWGWLTTRVKHQFVAAAYAEATEMLFGDVDYVDRNRRPDATDPVGDWFRARGLEPTHRSQDWVRDACFRANAMTHKLVCAQRRAAPIGERGLHSSPALFRQMGLDASTDDIDAAPEFDAARFRLVFPVRIRPGVPTAVAQHLVDNGDPSPDAVVVWDGQGAPLPPTRRGVLVGEPTAAALTGRGPGNTRVFRLRPVDEAPPGGVPPCPTITAPTFSLEAALVVLWFPPRTRQPTNAPPTQEAFVGRARRRRAAMPAAPAQPHRCPLVPTPAAPRPPAPSEPPAAAAHRVRGRGVRRR